MNNLNYITTGTSSIGVDTCLNTEISTSICYAKPEVRIEYVEKYPNFEIKKVHFNDPATIVLWADGTKTVVKCGEEDIYDPQTGLLMCMAKKMYGNTGKFNDILREWVPFYEEDCWSPSKECESLGEAIASSYTKGFNAFMEMITGRDNKKPEVMNKWIPCSVATPSCEDYYLVTIKSFENPCIRKWYADGWHSQYEVLAWMPMPDIYKEEKQC